MSLPPALEDALESFAAAPSRLVALDFDGVLAPIVEKASAARMSTSTRAALRTLVASGTTVALVSGRALADLREVAAAPDAVLLVGSHGAEAGGVPPVVSDADARRLADLVAALEAIAAAHEGAWVERKPSGAVLHTRGAARGAASAAATEALTGPGSWDGVHVTRGKEVVELSVGFVGKGVALQRLREALAAACVLYAGDDTTDEDAFAVLDPARGDVRVKVGEGETIADHRVDGPDDMPEVLRRLAGER